MTVIKIITPHAYARAGGYEELKLAVSFNGCGQWQIISYGRHCKIGQVACRISTRLASHLIKIEFKHYARNDIAKM